MSLYPSLDDIGGPQAPLRPPAVMNHPATRHSAPNVGDNPYAAAQQELQLFMGMQVTPEVKQELETYMPRTVEERRAFIKQGVRELRLCKGQDNKIGVALKAIDKGVFVSTVVADTPAAVAGLRFGDQLLRVGEEDVAGYSSSKCMKLLKKMPPGGFKVYVRDRPFERTITLNKDKSGHLGILLSGGKVKAIGKDTSAARNGMIINTQVLEINGQNIVALKDKEVSKIIENAGPRVTLTIIPYSIYKHMISNLGEKAIAKVQDHSIPWF
eukprot:Clim_evm22s204 gene=Clim_evmTU22s204